MADKPPFSGQVYIETEAGYLIALDCRAILMEMGEPTLQPLIAMLTEAIQVFKPQKNAIRSSGAKAVATMHPLSLSHPSQLPAFDGIDELFKTLKKRRARMELNETTLTDWYLVTIIDAPEPLNRILWGTIKEDPSMRWLPGDWCCTSVILDQNADNVLITKNTRYTLQGPGESVELPVKALIELMQGFSPDEVRLVIDNPELSLGFVRDVVISKAEVDAGEVKPYRFDVPED